MLVGPTSHWSVWNLPHRASQARYRKNIYIWLITASYFNLISPYFHTVIKWGVMCFRTVSSVSNIELLNSKDFIKVLGKEKESPCLVVLFSTKREISHFYGLVVQRPQRNVQKSVMHVQSCCFANLNLLLFSCSGCCCCHCCLSSLMQLVKHVCLKCSCHIWKPTCHLLFFHL